MMVRLKEVNPPYPPDVLSWLSLKLIKKGAKIQEIYENRGEKIRAVDVFRDIPRSSPERGARIINADEIDVLIDTTGHTATNCLAIMAHRSAPVQAHYLGYGLTSGGDFIDYLITDAVYIPPEHAKYCSEKLVYLPHTFFPAVRSPISDQPLTRADFGLPEHATVFTNFNRPNKFEPTVFSAWMRILEAVPESVLWLGAWTEPTQRNLHREASTRGIDPRRILFSD
ncbi:MAG: hypothetical protein IID39_05240, partial [Planctomycetes bacterium]|nr:hypothetical protein [Planctomycetota bacterium]